MALIDFECIKCGNKFFEIVNAEESNEVKCPDCGGGAIRVYKGRFYGKSSVGGSKGCSGSCGSCRGCR